MLQEFQCPSCGQRNMIIEVDDTHLDGCFLCCDCQVLFDAGDCRQEAAKWEKAARLLDSVSAGLVPEKEVLECQS